MQEGRENIYYVFVSIYLIYECAYVYIYASISSEYYILLLLYKVIMKEFVGFKILNYINTVVILYLKIIVLDQIS